MFAVIKIVFIFAYKKTRNNYYYGTSNNLKK